MKIIFAVAVVLAYIAVATFLCLAVVANPNLTDTQQWIWCAAAVGWGPALWVALYILTEIF